MAAVATSLVKRAKSLIAGKKVGKSRESRTNL